MLETLLTGHTQDWGSRMRNNPLTMLAVKYLTYQLRKDKGFWMAYQANIAMAIYDNYNKYMPLTTGKGSPTLLEFCNICANDFLKLWTRKQTK